MSNQTPTLTFTSQRVLPRGFLHSAEHISGASYEFLQVNVDSIAVEYRADVDAHAEVIGRVWEVEQAVQICGEHLAYVLANAPAAVGGAA